MNEFEKPEFLEGIKVTKKDYDRLWPLMTNWVVLSENIQKLIVEEDVKKMILIELNGKKRLNMIYRLKGRFNTLRKERENNEIIDLRTS